MMQGPARRTIYRGASSAAMLRTCPTCGVAPGKFCRRRIGGAEGYWVPLKNVHPARRPPRSDRGTRGNASPAA